MLDRLPAPVRAAVWRLKHEALTRAHDAQLAEYHQGFLARVLQLRQERDIVREHDHLALQGLAGQPFRRYAFVLAAVLGLCLMRGGWEKSLPPLIWSLCLLIQIQGTRVAGPLRWRSVW